MGNTNLYLNVADIKVRTIDIDYNDLVILYRQYIEKYGDVPKTRDCVFKNNLPQQRIVNKVLKEHGITYNDFLAQFGKYSHVRTNSVDKYDFYVQRFKDVCKEKGRTLTSPELTNNKFGLPNVGWLIKNCPDKNVKTYLDFVKWCNLTEAKHIWTKEEVSIALRKLEKQLDRPIHTNDVNTPNVGFSLIVVKRLFGGLNQAKKEIGLLETESSNQKPFDFYKESLKSIILDYKRKTGLKYISWADIESGIYGNGGYGHKVYTNAFKKAGVDIHKYIRSLGCMMNTNKVSYKYTFKSGERVESRMEYLVTVYLRKIGLEYNKDYFRSVKYKTFTDEKSNIDCDYVIYTPNGNFCIEVLGFIHNLYDDWKTHRYPSNIENEYRDKMILKENILKHNDIQYLFLFANDVSSGKYKSLIQTSLQRMMN